MTFITSPYKTDTGLLIYIYRNERTVHLLTNLLSANTIFVTRL